VKAKTHGREPVGGSLSLAGRQFPFFLLGIGAGSSLDGITLGPPGIGTGLPMIGGYVMVG
jgi:hypothetical protein